MDNSKLQNLMDRAKIGLMNKPDSAFYTTIAFSLKFRWNDNIPTARTDGIYMEWNPAFFESLTPDERIGVMVHEASHVAFDHMGRLNIGKTRCPDLYNKAADHVINLMIEARGFKLPSWALHDQRFVNMSTEQVYEILEAEANNGKPQPQNKMPDISFAPFDGEGAGDGQKGDGAGGNNPGQGSGGMTPEQRDKHIQGMIVRAVMASKMAGDKPGSIPGEVELFLDQLLNPKLPWQTLLRRFFTEFSKNDHSWKKPNRRFFPQFHLPSLYSINLQDMTFYVDISGSVEDFQFKLFVSEIAGVLKMLKPKKITIVQFDTKIQHEDTVTNLQELSKVKFHGRGGTHIECILKHMEDNKNSVSLVFTDGHFYWPRERFKGKILWLINDNEGWPPKFGQAIYFSTRDYQ